MKTQQENRMEKVLDAIETLLREFNSESGEKQAVAEQIIQHATIWGSQNGYEGIGILESAKGWWIETIEELEK